MPIRYTSFPKTEPPPAFVEPLVRAFREVESKISTVQLAKGLTSNEVLAVLRVRLKRLGFEIEKGKRRTDKIDRPVFYGENGMPALNYQIDAYHPEWHCGLEAEAGRAWMGNAVYRDLVQALIMVQVDYLALAVPIGYKYKTKGRRVTSNDYLNATSLADALYGHTRMRMPYKLIIIGY